MKKAGSNADAPLVVRPYRLTIDGESTFSDPNPAPQVMDERVARGPSLRRDPASLGTPKFRIGTDFDIGADYFMPGLQVQTALGRTVALGLHFAYNYQESRGTQRIWGLQGTLTVYGAEMAPYGLFAESRFGLYHLDATDAYGSESADNVALGQVFGWRAKIVPALALGGAVGAQYLVQSKTTRILDFSGLKPLATLELTLQF